jgi:TatA/E family protein of Tat protein translocase
LARYFLLSLIRKISCYEQCTYISWYDWCPTNNFNCSGFIVTFWRKKIPELMKGLGKGIKEFKSATSDEEGASPKGEVSEKKD